MSAPDPYGPGAGYHAPPGQTPYPPPPPPGNGPGIPQPDYNAAPPPQHHAYDHRDGRPIPPGFVPPHQTPASSDPQYDPHYFPPPPQHEYADDGYDQPPPAPDGRGQEYDQGPPRNDYDERRHGEPRGSYDDYDDHRHGDQRGNYDDYDDRRHGGPPEQEETQLTPYNEEKAEAEWNRGYEEDRQRRYSNPPPPSDYDRYDRRYDDRGDSRDRYDDRRRYGSQDRDHRRRRRRDSRYDEARSSTSMKNKPGPDVFGGKEGERGLGAQILGGAAGGLLGHEMGGGLMETLGGAVVGAIGAKVAEKQLEKRRSKKDPSMAGAPFKDQAVAGGRSRSHGRMSTRSPSRYDSRERDRYSPPRRGTSRRSRDDYRDDYASDYSRSPPPRR